MNLKFLSIKTLTIQFWWWCWSFFCQCVQWIFFKLFFFFFHFAVCVCVWFLSFCLKYYSKKQQQNQCYKAFTYVNRIKYKFQWAFQLFTWTKIHKLMVHSDNIVRILHRRRWFMCAVSVFTEHLNQQVVQPFNPMTTADTFLFISTVLLESWPMIISLFPS